jgi:hypothetical protein
MGEIICLVAMGFALRMACKAWSGPRPSPREGDGGECVLQQAARSSIAFDLTTKARRPDAP